MYVFQGLKHLSCWLFIFKSFSFAKLSCFSLSVHVLLRLHFKWHLSHLGPSIRVRAVQWPETGLGGDIIYSSNNAKRCLWGRSEIPITVKLTATFTEEGFFSFFVMVSLLSTPKYLITPHPSWYRTKIAKKLSFSTKMKPKTRDRDGEVWSAFSFHTFISVLFSNWHLDITITGGLQTFSREYSILGSIQATDKTGTCFNKLKG